MSPQRIKADLTLLLVAILWGISFVAARVAALHLGIYEFNGLRFLLGGLLLLPIALFTRQRRPQFPRKAWAGPVLAGLVMFFGISLQQTGMRYTTAANAGFITGLYVVLVPLMMALFWRKLPGLSIWVACGLAMVGLFLLSTAGHSLVLAPGDGLMLINAFAWGFHVILIGRLVKSIDPLMIGIIQNLVCGVASLLLSLVTEPLSGSLIFTYWWTVVYAGVFSIAIGFTLQAVAQKVAPTSDAAIILSGESVFAALSGWIFLGESLLPIQLLGCALILGGMLLAQVDPFKNFIPNFNKGG